MPFDGEGIFRLPEERGDSPPAGTPAGQDSQPQAGLQDVLVRVLRSVAGSIAHLTPDEFAALLSGRGKLVYVGPEDRVARGGRAAAPKQPRARKSRRSREELSEVEREFIASPDRESARSLLERSGLVKEDLLSLARSLAVPVKSGDRVETIRFKLVEGVVGARLRSEALRQTDVR